MKTDKQKAADSAKDLSEFHRSVAELKTELEKLPANRQEQFMREIEPQEEK